MVHSKRILLLVAPTAIPGLQLTNGSRTTPSGMIWDTPSGMYWTTTSGMDGTMPDATICVNTNGNAMDSVGYDCDDYTSHPARCDVTDHDTATFNATEMCCACEGGSDYAKPMTTPSGMDGTTPSGMVWTTPSGMRWTDAGMPDVTACVNTNGNAMDSVGYNCDDYASHPTRCDVTDHDTATFNGMKMCCACGGGSNYAQPIDGTMSSGMR